MYFRPGLLILSLLCSCTVLEDRDSCPCLLHLDVDESVADVTDSVRIWVQGDGFSFSAGLSSARYAEGITVTVTSRSGVNIAVMDASSAENSPDGSLEIPAGSQCPELYDFRSFCDTSSETAEEHICLHKNHCRVLVSFPEATDGQYAVGVAGNVCGYSFMGSCIGGDFACVPCRTGDGRLMFCIPRQKDSGLNMKIGTDEGFTRVFALGNYIVESGYDWSAADLEDVEVDVDYAASQVRLHFEGWPETEASDIVI